ncbi:MAG: GNAT family N-acetyltransferase [Almyronema sp.]
MFAVPGYELYTGSGRDRALLVQFLQRSYQELENAQAFAHLSQTVEQHFSADTPLWWVKLTSPSPPASEQSPVGCLWLGNAIEQISGDRHAYILLLYVDPQHRRRGLGTALMQQAIAWATDRGDRQIDLQVFCQNQAGLKLYEKLGFSPQSIWMSKQLSGNW